MSKAYHWCIVPNCTNTSKTTPEKVFINVPKNPKRRRKWITTVRRDPAHISASSVTFVCEDHFNLCDDMENYMKWKLTGCNKIMKKDCVPHKFTWQTYRAKRTCPKAIKSVAVKFPKLEIFNEIFYEPPKENAKDENLEEIKIESNIKNFEEQNFNYGCVKTYDFNVNVKKEPYCRTKNEADEGDSSISFFGSPFTSPCSSFANASLETYGTTWNHLICRFCLQNVNKENCTSLQFLQNSSYTEKEIEKSMEIETMIKFSFPYLDLSLSSAPMICDLCTTSLTSTYKFINQTMLNQNTIKAYMTENCIAGDVNLEDVVEMKKRRIDGEVHSVVKKLKQSKQPEKFSQATKQSEIIRKFQQAAVVERIDNIISDEGNSSDAGFVELQVEHEDNYMGFFEYSDIIKQEEIKIEDYGDYETIQTITEESTSDDLNYSKKMDLAIVDEIFCTSPEEDAAVTENIMLPKFKTKYNLACQSLINWLKSKNAKFISENLLLAYFNEVSKKWTPPTLWAHYSIIKNNLHEDNNIEITKYKKLTTFLKELNYEYRCRKSKVFTSTNINTFFNEAPDEKYLAMKVVCIFVMSGACSKEELHIMKVADVKAHGNIFRIKVGDTKTSEPKIFTVEEKFCDIVRKYIASRPKTVKINRFFLNWRNGKCTHRVMDINNISQIPQKVVEFLNFEILNASFHTGYTFDQDSVSNKKKLDNTSLITEKILETEPLELKQMNKKNFVPLVPTNVHVSTSINFGSAVENNNSQSLPVPELVFFNKKSSICK